MSYVQQIAEASGVNLGAEVGHYVILEFLGRRHKGRVVSVNEGGDELEVELPEGQVQLKRKP